ncbi:MAG: anion permease [Chthoniobacteraceae bacterium]
MTLFLLVLLAALAFEYINGFHDAANAIATVVSTKVLTPRQAILMAAGCNLLGAFSGMAVAKTIGADIVDIHVITMPTVFAALLGAIIWNLLTWWLGLPSSSSHALIGGLCGAAVASTRGDWTVLKWSSVIQKAGHITHEGLWPKVVLPMLTSPLAGFIIGAFIMMLLIILLHRMRPYLIQKIFGKAQLASAAFMGFSHGGNDAQKTMGIIALALYTGTTTKAFDNLPPILHFLRTPEFRIDTWVIIACALTMAAGTAGGGWRIIRTLGHKMVRLQPVHGFAAETSAGIVIHIATTMGIPVSTTHVISTSIMGVGATKRLSAVKWGVVQRIVWAWVLTLPTTAFLGWLAFHFLRLAGV